MSEFSTLNTISLTSPGIVRANNNICKGIGCGSKSPSYNYVGLSGRYCKKHYTYGMINVKHRRCRVVGCPSISPVYNYAGLRGEYCKKHAKADMVNAKYKRQQLKRKR